ncbi:uncharacterized protein LOC122856667 isoform X2 [Aphidius gifuensis]|uniref:uncharacterized protein LOC122856667 isoform X2 n=1 Tax=Aphidius gifuensis TaxID=684658 RepID=UPI001CDD3425|nr:uncharacterized protein LOC122856667 isoform X2 [Aphidius gifuensis]
MLFKICLFIMILHILSHQVSSRPTEESTKLTLNTPKEILDSNNIKPVSDKPTKWERAMEIASDASNKVIAVIAAREAREYARNASKTKKRSPELSTTISTPVHTGPLDDFLPPKTRETVRLENENGQSLLEVRKNKPIEGIFENFLKPKPLVDRISDDEKYGNSGDKFIGVGRALVNGFEGLSNIINKIIDLPARAVKNSSRNLTSALNQVGGKLIGLE